MRFWPLSAVGVVAEQAQAEFNKASDARVDQAVVHPISVASGGDDLLVGHALQVVGHGLGACTDFGRDLADGDLLGAGDGVEDAEPRVAGQNSKQTGEFVDFGRVDQGSLSECRWDEVGRWG